MLAPVRRHQILAAGSLAAILGGATPAMAYTSFDVIFDASNKITSSEGTGVSGKMNFNFSKIDGSANKYNLDLTITNTSPVGANPTGTLSAFAFNVPGSKKTIPDFKLLTYSPLASGFGDVYGASTRGRERNVNNGDTLDIPSNPLAAAFAPFGSFTFCARDTGSNCHGGYTNGTGLADGQSANVRFTLASNLPEVNNARQVAKSFYDLFNSWTPQGIGDFKSSQLALRFQQVTTSTGRSGQSDKVGGKPKPPEAPPDGVPGPVPALGAAAAFGFSRRLRRRIALARGRQAASI